MKKVTVIASFCLLAISAGVKAQESNAADLVVSPARLVDGKNTVRLPDGKGTVQFTKRGDRFADVIFTDAAGKATRLVPQRAGTGNLPKPTCQWPIPDACFSIPNSSKIGMCICKPTDLSSGEDYTVSLLLPAVQAAREAARRTSSN